MQQQQIPICTAVSISIISFDWMKSYTGHNLFHLLHHFFAVVFNVVIEGLVVPHQPFFSMYIIVC